MGTQTSPLITRIAPQLARLAADRRSLWLVLALALAVALPTLDAGLIGDDVAQQRFIAAQVERPAASPEAGAVQWWDMFVLVEGEAERTLGMRLAGRYPWWVDPDLRIRFFRPLSVATHYVDHWLARALWPGSVWPMHLHSVAWYLLACALVWGLARRLSSSAARGLEPPNFSWILHTGPREPEVVRLDDCTLELRDPSGFFREPFAAYWRSVERRPFAVGDEVRTLDYVAKVTAVDRGRPTAVRFTFRARLEHSIFMLAWWDGADYVVWSPPSPASSGPR